MLEIFFRIYLKVFSSKIDYYSLVFTDKSIPAGLIVSVT
jgi:hypothetical protein